MASRIINNLIKTISSKQVSIQGMTLSVGCLCTCSSNRFSITFNPKDCNLIVSNTTDRSLFFRVRDSDLDRKNFESVGQYVEFKFEFIVKELVILMLDVSYFYCFYEKDLEKNDKTILTNLFNKVIAKLIPKFQNKANILQQQSHSCKHWINLIDKDINRLGILEINGKEIDFKDSPNFLKLQFEDQIVALISLQNNQSVLNVVQALLLISYNNEKPTRFSSLEYDPQQLTDEHKTIIVKRTNEIRCSEMCIIRLVTRIELDKNYLHLLIDNNNRSTTIKSILKETIESLQISPLLYNFLVDIEQVHIVAAEWGI